ncbi:undecaprenyl-diphosphate phosphatase [Aestuariibius insulae]|uniref:undecaprenyl-diphosphate phosphatase n=1 Tax=Aestuariibius insulae TaxID=2058287 RepID=UPI00345EA33D
MPLLQLILVALIQGITEFLPVSSSGHLILLPQLAGYDDQGLAIDVAVHIGTLGAVILYFRQDVRLALSGLPSLLKGRIDGWPPFLALCLIVATLPVIIVGALLTLFDLTQYLRSMAVIGWAMLIFGLVLYWADRQPETRAAQSWTLGHALRMGLWQAVALIPGTSRSGITITAARHLGYDRESAARLAMLMSIPTILASGTLTGLEAAPTITSDQLRDIAIATALAFLAALGALVIMMRLLKSISFTPYVIYRCILGALLLVIAYS